MYMASDSYALAPLTKKISFLEDGDRVVVTRAGVTIYNKAGEVQKRPIRITAQSGATTGKGEYRHFMIKEIYEQPAVIGDTLNTFINPATGKINVPENILSALDQAPRLTMVACGTAYYACMVGKYWFEKIARLPVEIDVASEFRYREAPMPEKGVALFVSQSGETLDTLEALRYSKREKQTIISIVNTIESTIERESDMVLHTLAGPEIGVASTKAFTTQLTTILCMALGLAVRRGFLNGDIESKMTEALRHLPTLVADTIRSVEKPIIEIARDIADARDVLYIGRSYMYPVALEGALKLKEVSYIHAEGYAAGEMKHGPIALIDETVPVVVVAPGSDPLFEKTASNVQETVARGGQVMMITDSAGAGRMHVPARWQVQLGSVPIELTPILYTIPVQLLAYHVAIAKGTDVDQPRNLAKSVTVE